MIPSLFLLITGFAGFVTVALILKNYRTNTVFNIYLILIIVTISVRFFLTGLSYYTHIEVLNNYYFRSSNSFLIFIPLSYLYFKNLSNHTKGAEKNDLIHYIFPAIVFLFISNIDLFEFNSKDDNVILYVTFLLYVLFYTVANYQILKENIWAKKNIIKAQNSMQKKWTYFMFFAIVLLILRLIVSLLLEINFENYIKDNRFQWIAALIWLLVLFEILTTTELFSENKSLHKKINKNLNLNSALLWNTSSKITISNTKQLQLRDKIPPAVLTYIDQIEKIARVDKIFRNPSINIVTIAKALNVPQSHLSYLYKYHATVSFTEYKNALRIHDAVELINGDYLKEHTLDFLSKEVGFSSYTTFFTSFKEIVGISPIEYYKKIHGSFFE